MKHMSAMWTSRRVLSNAAFALMLPLLMSSCVSYDSWNRTTTGMTLGAFFGSTVGGLFGGQRGADLGTIVGGAAGAAVGAATAEKNAQQREAAYERRNEERYGRYDDEAYRRNDEQVDYGRYDNRREAYAAFNGLELNNLTFSDYNGDRTLQPGEHAQITFDLYNNTGRTLYNIAPVVACDYKRVNVSSTAIIAELPAWRALRYQAEVVARTNAREREVVFQIALPDASGKLQTIQSFNIALIKRR